MDAKHLQDLGITTDRTPGNLNLVCQDAVGTVGWEWRSVAGTSQLSLARRSFTAGKSEAWWLNRSHVRFHRFCSWPSSADVRSPDLTCMADTSESSRTRLGQAFNPRLRVAQPDGLAGSRFMSAQRYPSTLRRPVRHDLQQSIMQPRVQPTDRTNTDSETPPQTRPRGRSHGCQGAPAIL